MTRRTLYSRGKRTNEASGAIEDRTGQQHFCHECEVDPGHPSAVLTPAIPGHSTHRFS